MPGRGRGAKRRKTRQAETEPEEELSSPLDDVSKGNKNVVDFEEILQRSNVLETNTSFNIGCGAVAGNTPELVAASSTVPPLPAPITHLPCAPGGPSPIRLAPDDVAAHVPDLIRSQIRRGEFVNLALLLKGSLELTDFCSGTTLQLTAEGQLLSRPRECRDKIGTIEKWTDAFIIYMSIYIQANPSKASELLQYMWTIRECAGRQGGLAWRSYDEQFRLRQAFEPSSWAHINTDLWWRCMLMPAAATPAPSPRGTFPSRMARVCHFFNMGSCTWPNCRFRHICSSCGQGHSASVCTLSNRVPQRAQSFHTSQHFNVPRQPFRGRHPTSFNDNIRGATPRHF
ncbi:uncharacterized protein LOC128244073 [Mya arenaria]|uniref:uncharacterized protein LOC128244073 n=1 Tax=Mya arenaria TaxID=6604 RepID=UPI0022E1DCBD|nr:uncharacterized protein LOC128244073 [Mya arenaria]